MTKATFSESERPITNLFKKRTPSVEWVLPKCDKCGNTPLKCKYPDDCGMENL